MTSHKLIVERRWYALFGTVTLLIAVLAPPIVLTAALALYAVLWGAVVVYLSSRIRAVRAAEEALKPAPGPLYGGGIVNRDVQ